METTYHEDSPEPGPERLETGSHSQVAKLRLSGSEVRIGVIRSPEGDDDAIFLHTDEGYEAIYITSAEAKLLIAALTCAIDEMRED